MRPVFVVGCPRSGTSWVRNILGAHPAAHAGPESHLYPTVHGVADTWGDGPARWADVLARYDAHAGHGGAGPHRWIDRAGFGRLLEHADGLGGPSIERADDIIAGVIDHYGARVRLGPATILVEKTPEHIFWADRILARFSEARIVEVRRDGRDVCVSMERRGTRVAWPPRERAEQIRRWVEAVSVGLRCSAAHAGSGRWHVVRFEDLTADRRRELGRLFSFAGLDVDAELVDAIASSTEITRQRIVGDGEHVRSGAVGDWRAYLDDADLQLFDAMAGDLSRAIGY